jgi:hypothetical protein
MSTRQHMVLGGQDLDLSSKQMEEDEDEWKLVGRKPADEKATMRNGNGMTPVASDIGTTGIMVTIYVYRACGKMMKSVKTVNKRWLKRIRMKEAMSTYSNGNLRKLTHIIVKAFGEGHVSLE